MSGEIEFDEIFVNRRWGTRGRDAAGKVMVFEHLERNGYVHAKVTPNATASILKQMLREKVRPCCFGYIDTCRAYDVAKGHWAALDLRVKRSELSID